MKAIDKIEQIGFSLSNRCQATCIFCPSTKKRTGDMSVETVQKIITEIKSTEFKNNHNLLSVRVSENGDGLLNPYFIEIIRLFKTIPELKVYLNTTFYNMTETVGNIIINENLIDEIVTYVDGNINNYEKIKHLHYSTVENNLTKFLDNKNRKIKVNILHLGLKTYIDAVYRRYGFYPSNITQKDTFTLEMLKDNFEEIKDKYSKYLKPQDRIIRATPILGWAERTKIKALGHDQSKFRCYRIPLLHKEMMIAPNGDVYACCNDDTQQNIFGNVLNNSLDSIFNSRKREDFIHNVERRNYIAIGYPCNIVESCQNLESPYLNLTQEITDKAYRYAKSILNRH